MGRVRSACAGWAPGERPGGGPPECELMDCVPAPPHAPAPSVAPCRAAGSGTGRRGARCCAGRRVTPTTCSRRESCPSPTTRRWSHAQQTGRRAGLGRAWALRLWAPVPFCCCYCWPCKPSAASVAACALWLSGTSSPLLRCPAQVRVAQIAEGGGQVETRRLARHQGEQARRGGAGRGEQGLGAQG